MIPGSLSERTLAAALAEWRVATVGNDEARAALHDALARIRRQMGETEEAARLLAEAQAAGLRLPAFERWLDKASRRDLVAQAIDVGDLDRALFAVRAARGWLKHIGILQLIRAAVEAERHDIAAEVAAMARRLRPARLATDAQHAAEGNYQLACGATGDEAEVRAMLALARTALGGEAQLRDLAVMAAWRGLDVARDEGLAMIDDAATRAVVRLAVFDRGRRRGVFETAWLEGAEAEASGAYLLAEIGWRWASVDPARARRCLDETVRLASRPEHAHALAWTLGDAALAYARAGLGEEALALTGRLPEPADRVHMRLRLVLLLLREPALDR